MKSKILYPFIFTIFTLQLINLSIANETRMLFPGNYKHVINKPYFANGLSIWIDENLNFLNRMSNQNESNHEYFNNSMFFNLFQLKQTLMQLLWSGDSSHFFNINYYQHDSKTKPNIFNITLGNSNYIKQSDLSINKNLTIPIQSPNHQTVFLSGKSLSDFNTVPIARALEKKYNELYNHTGSVKLITSQETISALLNNAISLKFTELWIPADAVVTKASLTLFSTIDSTSEPTNVLLALILPNNNIATYTYQISEPWIQGKSYQIEIQKILQYIIKNKYWCAGQAIKLLILGDKGNREVSLLNNNIQYSPKIDISYRHNFSNSSCQHRQTFTDFDQHKVNLYTPLNSISNKTETLNKQIKSGQSFQYSSNLILSRNQALELNFTNIKMPTLSRRTKISYLELLEINNPLVTTQLNLIPSEKISKTVTIKIKATIARNDKTLNPIFSDQNYILWEVKKQPKDISITSPNLAPLINDLLGQFKIKKNSSNLPLTNLNLVLGLELQENTNISFYSSTNQIKQPQLNIRWNVIAPDKELLTHRFDILQHILNLTDKTHIQNLSQPNQAPINSNNQIPCQKFIKNVVFHDTGHANIPSPISKDSLLVSFQNDYLQTSRNIKFSLLPNFEKNTSQWGIPALGINQLQTSNDKELFIYALFSPSVHSNWQGNLKRYQFDYQQGIMVDKNNNNAFKKLKVTDSLWFHPKSHSFWPEPLYQDQGAADGDQIHLGGVAEQIKKDHNRNLYTFNGSYNKASFSNGWASTPKISFNSSELLAHPNNHITTSQKMLNHWQKLIAMPTKELTQLISWVLNENTSKANIITNTNNFGASINGTAEIVNLDETISSTENSAINPGSTKVIFLSTNAGFLHAFNASSGQEIFAFKPQELLTDHLPQLYYSQNHYLSQPSLLYSLDASWIAWRNDHWQRSSQRGWYRDGKITPNSNDHIYLYGGMRRGGNHYFALDVTPATQNKQIQINPKLLFVLHGGQQAPKDSPYRQLGQTWSVPTLIQVRKAGKIHQAIVFGGGYDADHYDPIKNFKSFQKDQTQPRQTDLGNQIFIVDATSGELLWWCSHFASSADVKHKDMKYSITTQVKAFDSNFDGFTDFLYSIDIKGQIFRIDINNSNSSLDSEFADVYKIAELGGKGSNNRHFFHAPSISPFHSSKITKTIDGFALAVLSGNVPNPHETNVEHQFFMLFDYPEQNISNIPLQPNDLPIVKTTDGMGVKQTINSKGWRFMLGKNQDSRGEKAFSAPMIYQGMVFFATYIPPTDLSDDSRNCQKHNTGKIRLYAMDALQAKTTNIFKNFSNTKFVDRAIEWPLENTLTPLQMLVSPQGIYLLLAEKILSIGESGDLIMHAEIPTLKKTAWRRILEE